MDNIYPDQSNDKFDIQYARLLGLSSDIRASFGSGEDGSDPVIKTPDDGSSGFMRFGVAAEDYRAGENRSFDLNGAHSFALTQAGNNQFLVDPTNGLYQLGAVPVPGSDSGLSYTYLEIDDSDGKILLQAPEGIVLPGYGYGNHGGTETFFLAIDAGGNLIEVTGGSGSGTVNTGIAPRAAYYPVTGAAVDDWIGVEFGNTNLNTRIISQNLADVALEIKAIASQSANLLNISSSAGTGDLITVDGSGNSTFKQRARFQGAVVETAVGVDRVDIGVAAGTPRIVFEDAGGTIWEVDNLNGIFRWFTPGVVQMDLSTSAASFANGLSVGTILGGSAPARQLHVIDNNATNSAVTQVFRMTHTTTGTPSVGIGTGMEFEAETGVLVNKVGAIIQAVTTNVGSGTEAFDLSFKTMTGGAAATESLRIISDGQLKITTITQDDTEDKIVVWNSTDKILEWRDAATLSGGGSGFTTADNGLTASTSTNVQLFGPVGTPATLLDDRYLDAGAFTLNITANSLAGAAALNITSISTAAASNLQKGISVELSGANSNSNQRTYGIYASNSHTGSVSFNYGVYGTASGATAVNAGVVGESEGIGVVGRTVNGTAVEGAASAGGQGVYGHSDSGNAIVGISMTGYAEYLITQPSGTNNINITLLITRLTSGTAANGIGTGIEFDIEADDGDAYESNKLISKWTSAAAGARTSQLDITGINSGSTATYLSLSGAGSFRLGDMDGASPGNNTYLEIDDVNQQINFRSAGSIFMNYDIAFHVYGFGDLPLTNNSTYFQINDNDSLFKFSKGALLLDTQFTPSSSSDTGYPAKTLTVDDTYLWFRTSGGTWKKIAWTAF